MLYLMALTQVKAMPIVSAGGECAAPAGAVAMTTPQSVDVRSLTLGAMIGIILAMLFMALLALYGRRVEITAPPPVTVQLKIETVQAPTSTPPMSQRRSDHHDGYDLASAPPPELAVTTYGERYHLPSCNVVARSPLRRVTQCQVCRPWERSRGGATSFCHSER